MKFPELVEAGGSVVEENCKMLQPQTRNISKYYVSWWDVQSVIFPNEF